MDLITTGDFMSRFCSNLCLPKQVQMAATHIARKAVELDLVPGRSPISVAAAAIYMASQASAEKRTQKGRIFIVPERWQGWELMVKKANYSESLRNINTEGNRMRYSPIHTHLYLLSVPEGLAQHLKTKQTPEENTVVSF